MIMASRRKVLAFGPGSLAISDVSKRGLMTLIDFHITVDWDSPVPAICHFSGVSPYDRQKRSSIDMTVAQANMIRHERGGRSSIMSVLLQRREDSFLKIHLHTYNASLI